MKKEYIECGCVRTAHGVRGLLKIESWCDTPKVLAGQKRVFIAEGEGKFKELSVLSASVMDSIDPAILIVLREELPPYFLDQKSFDDVLKIIQDRVSTIIAERK